MSAQPDTDRSLNADKQVTEPGTATNAAPSVDAGASAPSQDQKAAAGNTSPDLSSLSHEELGARVKTLSDSLAAATAESENFREQWTELKLRDEALGVEALTGDEAKTQEKLVQAVKELYQTEIRRREAVELMNKLLVSTDQMLQTAPKYDPQVRAQYEEATRSAKAYLAGGSGSSIPLGTSLSDGQISDTNPELNAVILNLGKNQGVKEGMLFLVYQDNLPVGTVKTVLARDLISAAQVETLKPNTVIKVGDRVAVDAQP
jgi:hypothetical protein